MILHLFQMLFWKTPGLRCSVSPFGIPRHRCKARRSLPGSCSKGWAPVCALHRWRLKSASARAADLGYVRAIILVGWSMHYRVLPLFPDCRNICSLTSAFGWAWCGWSLPPLRLVHVTVLSATCLLLAPSYEILEAGSLTEVLLQATISFQTAASPS